MVKLGNISEFFSKFYESEEKKLKHDNKKYGTTASDFIDGTATQNTSFSPQYFQPIYTEIDLETFQGLYGHTLIGKTIDVNTDHVMGDGIRPVAEWRRPNKHGKNKDEQRKGLEEFDDIMDDLQQYDEHSKIKLDPKTRDAFRQTLVFGRSVLAFEWNDYDGTGLIPAEPPAAIKSVHPRMLGQIYVDQQDWSLQSVIIHTKYDHLCYADSMIYFCNKPNSPVFRNMHYGQSEIQRVAGHGTVLRELTEFDLIEIAKTMWAGYGVITVDQEGLEDYDKQSQLNKIIRSMRAGAWTAISKTGEKGIEFNQYKFQNDLNGLKTIMDTVERSIIGDSQIPAPFLGRDENTNMATLFAATRQYYHGPVRQKRKIVSEALRESWYERNLSFYNPNLLKDVKISVKFENLPIDAWMGALDQLEKLHMLVPQLPIEELLKLADLDYLVDQLDMSDDSINDPETQKMIAQATNNPQLKTKLQELLKSGESIPAAPPADHGNPGDKGGATGGGA